MKSQLILMTEVVVDAVVAAEEEELVAVHRLEWAEVQWGGIMAVAVVAADQ